MIKMGGIFTDKLKIQCDVDIFKISDNVFNYDKIDCDSNFIINISKLLDKGIKFVPNYFTNVSDVYDNI